MTEERDNRLAELKYLLTSTDYIMSQITEAEQFHPEDVAALRNKYANVVLQRVQWRREIQELQKEV